MHLNEYQEQAATTAVYPEEVALLYLALKLNGEAGEVAELIAKMYRDEDGNLSPMRKVMLQKELGDVLWYVSELARMLGYSLEQIAQMNIDKLADRARRGVIKGSGDER